MARVRSGNLPIGSNYPSVFCADGLMATLENLVATIAEVQGIGAERVRAIARAVREAGLIAKHGRGTSAAEMSETDAANLLIAVNVADTARTSQPFQEVEQSEIADDKSIVLVLSCAGLALVNVGLLFASPTFAAAVALAGQYSG